jgi:hypothetical protein
MRFQFYKCSEATFGTASKFQLIGIFFLAFSALLISARIAAAEQQPAMPEEGISRGDVKANGPSDYAPVTAKESHETEEQICLSLRVLAREAETDLVSGRPLRKEVESLAGISWLEGFVVDLESPDIILIGQCCEKRPLLHLDDLVVNMRNIWSSNVYPYCSLDPQPKNVVKINGILSGSGKVENVNQMHQLFSELQSNWGPQTVVVGGVPVNSRHAHVMIDSDYHMKQVSQGLANITVIPSCLDIAINEANSAIQERTDIPASAMSMSRFWFHIGEGDPKFTESNGIVCLDKCSVIVLTERQRATADGQLYDSGGDDHIAKAFAQEFSSRFAEAANTVPVYADLENLYRLIALLKAIYANNEVKKGGIDLQFFMKRYKYQKETPMPSTMPGLANYKKLQQTLTTGDAIYEYVFFPMVCGGVSMEIEVNSEKFTKENVAQLDQLRLAVIKVRPNTESLYWPLPKSIADLSHGNAHPISPCP